MLKDKDLDAVYAHATREYPYECCGIITGDGNGNNQVHPCLNMQNELHKKDPIANPRDGRTAYFMDPRDVFRIIKKSEEKGEKVLTFYHSHPDQDAYFSQTDKERALMEGEPVYDADYLIVSVFNRKVKEAITYHWNEEGKKFVKKSFVEISS